MGKPFKRLDQYLLNAVPDMPDVRDRMYEPTLKQLADRKAPPDRLGILDQGREGACTGFGLAAVINILYRLRGKEVQASPRMLYEMARKFDEWPGEDYSGSSCRGAISGWYNMGVCRDDLWRYEVDDRSFLTVNRARDARNHTLGAYYRLRHDPVDFHAALNEVEALYVSASVHDGWSNEAVRDGVIDFKGDEKVTGGHAFAIVGYDERGFWIQNSWGESWGKKGLALWTYEDWQANIKDAWVVRLAVPTPQIRRSASRSVAGFSGGKSEFLFGGPSRGEIKGHFVHIDDGRFHDQGKYWSNSADIDETANVIRETTKYDHLLLYAHGGLNDTKASAGRIKAMKDVFRKNRIYPFHFMYDTGLMEEIKDIIFRKKPESHERAGDFFNLGEMISEMTDRMLERATSQLGRALWREMKSGARSPFKPQGAGTRTISSLISAANDNQREIKIHLAGHSTGGILMAFLLERARQLFPDLRIATCSLMAPAGTVKLFNSHYKPHLTGGRGRFGINRMTVYNLSEQLEKDDNVGFIYRKSLLYLVSRAFEEKRKAAILGMKKYSRNITVPNLKFEYSEGEERGSAPTASTSHGEFDNDMYTMNNIVKRVLGRTPVCRKFTRDDLKY
ncbi:MAG: C1 family peptidase [bacterium]